MIRRVLSGSIGSANKTASAVCGKRQRENQPWAVAPLLLIYQRD